LPAADSPDAAELAQLYRTGALDRINETRDRLGLGGGETRSLLRAKMA
jgi:hypothetical protein